jgi:hypothetical protein
MSRLARVTVVLLAAVFALALIGRMSRPAPRVASRAELEARFASDTRNLVYRWDEADTRSADDRQQALLNFMYQTYDSAAWIPQSLFDANAIAQAVVGDVNTIVHDKVGLTMWPENQTVIAYGMAPDTTPGRPLRWTVNCLVCHTAEIDGVAYLGAGTKMFDDFWLGESLKHLTSANWRLLLRPGSEDDRLAAAANRILNSHHHDKIDSLTRARSTAFAASHVELYMRPHDGRMPSVSDVGRGDVKTPPLWHTAAKMPVGRWYSDGSFHGAIPLMASSMELEKDRPFDALVNVVIPEIKREFDDVVRYLRPPPYPYGIDRELAERGKALFYSETIGCSRCHGVYDGRGNVDWPGVHRDVGTDRSRIDVVSEGFVDAFDHSPIAAEGALMKSRGYAATPLTGVWANFPYLHNGSVPTIYHLLGPVGERPRMFEVMGARSFDRDRVGQRLVAQPAYERFDQPELFRRFGDNRDWINVERAGCFNGGHDVWPRIKTDDNRRALIEYLKTL